MILPQKVYPKKHNSRKIRTFFSQWSKHALENDLLKITGKSFIIFRIYKTYKLSETQWRQCRRDTKILRDFIKGNNNLVVCPVDKYKDLIVYTTEQCIEKLNDVFQLTNFLKQNLLN